MQEPKTVNVYKCNCVIVSLNPKSRPIGMEEKGNLTKIKNLMPFFKVMWKFTVCRIIMIENRDYCDVSSNTDKKN